ncbi:MAG: redoxin domain-containing protein [Pyrinomonadaceae bacterium]
MKRLTLAMLLTIVAGGSESPSKAIMGGPPVALASFALDSSHVATDFALKDQYDKLQVYQFPRSRVTVLAFGDRKGSEQIESRVRPLYERYKERVDIHGVAVLSAVPTVARGVVRRIMKHQVKQPVMLDWSGSVAKKYDYTSGAASIVVIDRNGRILLRTAGAANDTSLGRVYGQIDKLLP